jgi:hypothetical protein
MDEGPDAGTIVGLLAEEDRLRVVAALALGASSTAAVVEATGLDRRRAVSALERLVARGLVERGPEGALRLAVEQFKAAARQGARTGEGDSDGDPLRPFVRGGRLVSLPAQRSRRRAVLDWLAGAFEPGRHYAEREVNRLLTERIGVGAIGVDHVTLRRYLVDEGFLDRRESTYWRAGGTFEV